MICADERQWVPADAQMWATLEQLAQAGRRVRITELELDLFGIRVEPKVGIGQQTHLVRTRDRNLLWDPVGHLDNEAVNRVRELGEVTAIAASHPHMFGVQVEWSRALGGVPVLVSEADVEWLQRPDPAITTGSGSRRSRPRATSISSPESTPPGLLSLPISAGGRDCFTARGGAEPDKSNETLAW